MVPSTPLATAARGSSATAIVRAGVFAEDCGSSAPRVHRQAAGDSHSSALAKDGMVFSWDLNNYGQLRIGHAGTSVEAPRTIDTLSGLPVCALAAGGFTATR